MDFFCFLCRGRGRCVGDSLGLFGGLWVCARLDGRDFYARSSDGVMPLRSVHILIGIFEWDLV